MRYKKLEQPKKFFKCDCTQHAIEIQYDQETDEFYIDLWRASGIPNRMPFWNRLKLAFRILLRKETSPDEVIIDRETARKLRDFLSNYIEAKSNEILFKK